MPKKQPLAKGRRVCPFCNGQSANARVTGEHIWPEWAAGILPQRQSKEDQHFKGMDGFDRIIEVRKNFVRQGSPSGFKIRGPCADCNSGWMGIIENDTKPILSNLAQGKTNYLNRKESKQLAKWCFLKFTVKSCMDGEMWCVSDNQRKALMERGEIAKPFSAWFLRHETDDWLDRNRWFSSRAGSPTFTPSLDQPHNVNTLTLGFGKALFFMLFDWGVRLKPRFRSEYVTKLYPMRASGGTKVPDLLVSEIEINRIARTLPDWNK